MRRSSSKKRGLGGHRKRSKKAAVRKQWWSSIGTHILVALLAAISTLAIPKVYNHFFVPDNTLEAVAPPAFNSLQEVSYGMHKPAMQEFASVFQHKVQVKNKGSQTAFNVKLSIEPSSQDEELQLEKVSTSPAGWEHIVNARDSTDSKHPYVHIVDIDQLGPQQTLILDYVGRSKSYMPTSRLAVKAAAREYKEMVRPGPGVILYASEVDDVWLGRAYSPLLFQRETSDDSGHDKSGRKGLYFGSEGGLAISAGQLNYIPTMAQRNYTGFLDVTDCNSISGWAADRNRLNTPVADDKLRVGRFGWKNQHASLLSFSGDAYLNEIGITSNVSIYDGSASFTIQVPSSLRTISGYNWGNTLTSGEAFSGTISGSNFVSGSSVFFCVNDATTCYQQSAAGVNVISANNLSVSNVNLSAGSWQIYTQPSDSPYVSFAVEPPSWSPTITGYDWERTSTSGQAFNGTIDGTNFVVGGTSVLFCVNCSNNSLNSQPIADVNQVNQIAGDIPKAAAIYEQLLGHPAAIVGCDIVLPNYYPYWKSVSTNTGFTILHSQHQQIVSPVQRLPMMVSQAGWPSGNFICNAVRSPSNTGFAFLNFVNWAGANDVSYFYFDTVDEPWKANDKGPLEEHWGMWQRDMQVILEGKTMPDNWRSARIPCGKSSRGIEFSNGPSRSAAYQANGRCTNQDQSLRIKVLESDGAPLEVQSIDDQEVSPSRVPLQPTGPVKVNIVNSGGSELSIVTSENIVRIDKPIVTPLSRAHLDSAHAYCYVGIWIDDVTTVRLVKPKETATSPIRTLLFPCGDHRTPRRTVPTTRRVWRVVA